MIFTFKTFLRRIVGDEKERKYPHGAVTSIFIHTKFRR
jgi:hypothetical protein